MPVFSPSYFSPRFHLIRTMAAIVPEMAEGYTREDGTCVTGLF